ncbi:MAG: phosphoribosyltransferase regulatory subunit [Caulobacter sp.]|nr:phosphoribosyltransferase regulatory subunit [Caulobacter sp.]
MRLEPAVTPDALAAIRAPFAAAGAAPVDVPVIQPLSLLLDLAGEAMRARLFVVQGEGMSEAALRPDFTIPVARAHLESGAAGGRYLYEGKAFRVAPRGSGRAEEFLQLGVEAFEAGDKPAADAEIAVLAWRAAVAGGRSDLSLRLGDVSLFAAFVDSLGLDKAAAARLKRAFSRPRILWAELDQASKGGAPVAPASRLPTLLASLPKAEAAAALQELWTLAGIEPVGGRTPAEIVHRLVEKARAAEAPGLTEAQADPIRRFLAVSGPPAKALEAVAALAGSARSGLDAALNDWTRRLAALTEGGVPADRMTLSTAFGRSFGYYDGVLFEVRSEALGDDRPVAAGGRYDGLLPRLGGKGASGAVGCMVRPARAVAGGVE